MALEQPSENSELIQGKVSDMGLVVYTPTDFHTPVMESGDVAAALTGSLEYVHVEENDEGFLKYLGEVLDVLILDKAPAPPPPKGRWSGSYSSCPYCQFLHDARLKNLIHDPGH